MMLRQAARSAMLVALLAATGAGAQQADARRSGFDFMSPALQAMQRDDAQNPGMLWVADGEALWKAGAAPTDKSCAACHGDAPQSMRGLAARYPGVDAATKQVLTLSQRINLCRVRHQQLTPLPAESQGLLGLQAYVALQSRGLPMTPTDAPEVAAAQARGRGIFQARIGQLNLACATCHDGLAGRSLAGNSIPQAHATGYPTYRLEWQSLGSLPRRLRNCLTGVRAEPYAFDAPALTDLEAYLAARAAGLPLEAPAVRP